MISIIKADRENYSFLLKVVHHNPDQLYEIAEAIMAEGSSSVYECGDYWVVIPNDDYTTFDKMSAVIHGLMDKYNDKAPAVNEDWHYKFEDLNPVFASEIQGGMDPNDEYYPRQQVDAAICELDAHRLCFDTDRKYYTEQYDNARKRWMDYENRLLHSNYRRSCRIVKDCRRKLLEWKNLCTIFSDPKALEVAKAKVALWTKWEARWVEISHRYICF
jgi:hypothetical protein